MATKTITLLQDDTDGSEAAETVRFGLDGADYQIDLSDKNAANLRKAFQPWANAARKVRGPGRGRRSGNGSGLIDTKAVRAWAESNGIELSRRGRIPADVVEKYKAAGH